MFKVNVKIPASFGQPSEQSLQRALNALSAFAKERITSLAQERLSPRTAPTYIRGINTPTSVKVEGNKATVMLVGMLPNMLEKGAGSFDIKKAMLANSKKGKSKGYVDVPFQHGAPGSTRRPAMPKADYNVMMRTVRSAKSALRSAGVGAAKIAGTTFRGPSTMPTGPKTKSLEGGKEYTHKASVYADMLRIPKTYASRSQHLLTTIRRISKNSDPSSWIHPGLQALHIFPLVVKDVKKLAPKLIRDYLKQGL